nr:MAG TPA: Putative viral replication protein [Cressdnaviricota sp.]
MTQDDTTIGGNTKISNRSRKWVYTINNPCENYNDTLYKVLKENKGQFVFQLERGELGTEHIQGYVEFRNARSFNSVKSIIPTAHIEKCMDSDASISYCQKLDTRINGPWGTLIKRVIKDPLENKTLKQWQQNILDLIKTEPDDRSIRWYYDEVGGCGKTSLAKHLFIHNENEIVYCTGKVADVKYAIKSFIENGGWPRVVIFDFSRTIENFVSYEALEAVKNGLFFNTKYESGVCIFNPPHIIVFANFKPDKHKLSRDRWVVEEIA